MRKLTKPLSILLSLVMIFSVFTIIPCSASTVTTQIFVRKWIKSDQVRLMVTDMINKFPPPPYSPGGGGICAPRIIGKKSMMTNIVLPK